MHKVAGELKRLMHRDKDDVRRQRFPIDRTDISHLIQEFTKLLPFDE